MIRQKISKTISSTKKYYCSYGDKTFSVCAPIDYETVYHSTFARPEVLIFPRNLLKRIFSLNLLVVNLYFGRLHYIHCIIIRIVFKFFWILLYINKDNYHHLFFEKVD